MVSVVGIVLFVMRNGLLEIDHIHMFVLLLKYSKLNVQSTCSKLIRFYNM